MEIYYNHIFLCSRHDVGGRRKKDLHNFVQLSFTKIYRHLNFMPITSSHHFVSSHHCALISPRLHRWNFPDSKQRPILSPLTLTRRTTKRSDCRLIFIPTRLGGENPRQNENIALEPHFGKGKLPVVLEHSHSHSHLHQLKRERPRVYWCDITLTPLRFSFSAVCVCEWSSHACWWKIFNFKMATDVFSQLLCLDRRETFRMRRFEGELRSLALIARNFYISRSRVCVPYSTKKI